MPGDLVEVRSVAEILSTLDKDTRAGATVGAAAMGGVN